MARQTKPENAIDRQARIIATVGDAMSAIAAAYDEDSETVELMLTIAKDIPLDDPIRKAIIRKLYEALS